MHNLLTAFGEIDWRERIRPVANVWVGAGALTALALLLLVLLNPAFAVGELGDLLQRRANLTLSSDSARFQFFPQPALRINGVRLSTGDAGTTDLVTAEAAIVPITFRTLLSRKLKPSAIHLERPVVNILINAKGLPLWSGIGDALDAALAENSIGGEALTVTTADGVIKFLDEQHGQHFQLDQAALDLVFGHTGSVDMRGTLAIAEQFTRIEAHVDSLKRLVKDGSPADMLLAGPLLEASYSGLAGLRGGASLAGTFAAGSDSASKLAGWLGLRELAGIPMRELRMSGPLRLQAGEFNSKELNLRVGNTTMTGDVTVATGGARPIVSGNLKALRLTLVKSSAGRASALGWADEPLAIGWINDVDLNLTIDVEKLAARRMSIGPASFKLRTSDGTLTADLLRSQAYGGSTEATLSIDASKSPPTAALRLLADTLDLGQAGRDLLDTHWLQAKGGLTLDVSVSGKSIEEMVSTLGGDASISLTEASVTGFDLPASISSAAGAEREGWVTTAGSTQMEMAEGSFRLKDGIATSEDLHAKIAGVAISVRGDIDLLRKAVNVELKPSAKKDALAIRAAGPWQKPKLSVATPAVEADLKKAAKRDGDLLAKPEGN